MENEFYIFVGWFLLCVDISGKMCGKIVRDVDICLFVIW